MLWTHAEVVGSESFIEAVPEALDPRYFEKAVDNTFVHETFAVRADRLVEHPCCRCNETHFISYVYPESCAKYLYRTAS